MISPGKPFTLTHYWKVNEPLGEEWKMFVHLEAPGTKANHLNADHVPIGGKYPVPAWKKGEIVRDIHRVSVPAGWKALSVEVYTGIWKGAASTGAFVKTQDGAPAEDRTEARVLWDDRFLYVGFTIADKDVWSTLDKRDDKLWTQEAVEVFLDADGDGKTYVELQANPKGAIFDSYLPKYRENQNDFDSGMKVAVSVDGTLDRRNDVDKGWTVEMQVPLSAARGKEKEMKNVPPQVGTSWRANFFRMDLPAGKPQQGTAWSPPLVGDFHALDKFGELLFGDDKGGTVPPPAAAPATAAGGAERRPATKLGRKPLGKKPAK